MPGDVINTLIEAGIAGVFAVFAILLFKEAMKSLKTTQEMFIQFLQAEREQRMKIMAQANENLKELTVAVQKINGGQRSREKTQPRRDKE